MGLAPPVSAKEAHSGQNHARDSVLEFRNKVSVQSCEGIHLYGCDAAEARRLVRGGLAYPVKIAKFRIIGTVRETFERPQKTDDCAPITLDSRVCSWCGERKPERSFRSDRCVECWTKVNQRLHASARGRRVMRLFHAKAFADHTETEWLQLQAVFGYRCAACDMHTKLTKDHIVPISRGGSNSITNIQPLCRPCNSSKGIAIIDYR